MGFTFAFTESFIANQRQKNDPINGATGACAAGFLAGVRCTFIEPSPPLPFRILIYQRFTARSLPMAIGGCAVLGAVMGAYDYAGQLAGEPGLTIEEKRKRFFKPGTPIPGMPSAPSTSSE